MQCPEDMSFEETLKSSEQCMDISLYDADTTDSGYSDENHCTSEAPKHFSNLIDSPLLLENDPETSICFSPVKKPLCEQNRSSPDNCTPNKSWLAKKRPANRHLECLTPSKEAAHSLKRLKIFGINEECNEQIKNAVEKSAEITDLIGDFTKQYYLPTIAGFHPDLKAISAETMKDILEGHFDHTIKSFKIIDSRYPYEYEGGHIEGAINIYTKEDCLKLLEEEKKKSENLEKDERHIIIFHCEFSMERGPSMSRHLRKQDRQKNEKNYPELHYPEIYILEGGYKHFFQKFPNHCVPSTYKAMLHPGHEDDLKFFRKKSKSSDCDFRIQSRKPSKVVRKFLTTDD